MHPYSAARNCSDILIYVHSPINLDRSVGGFPGNDYRQFPQFLLTCVLLRHLLRHHRPRIYIRHLTQH